VRFTQGRKTSYVQDIQADNHKPDLSPILDEVFGAIRNILLDALGSQAGLAKDRISWQSAILAKNQMEGSLALIICLAVNFKSITLATKGGTYRELVIRVMWRLYWYSAYRPSSSFPTTHQHRTVPRFSKLRRVRLCKSSHCLAWERLHYKAIRFSRCLTGSHLVSYT
jgi:hypothetical protein